MSAAKKNSEEQGKENQSKWNAVVLVYYHGYTFYPISPNFFHGIGYGQSLPIDFITALVEDFVLSRFMWIRCDV